MRKMLLSLSGRLALLVIGLALFTLPADAASITIHSVHAALGDCENVFIIGINHTISWTEDDGGGSDLARLSFYDGNGTLIGNPLIAIPAGMNETSNLSYGFFTFLATPQSRPFTAVFYDLPSNAELSRITFDPGIYGVCTKVPLIVPANSSASPNTPQPAFTDGRINNWDTASPVVLYGYDDNQGRGLHLYSPDGVLLLDIGAGQIAAVDDCPASNTLIASTGAISLYRLSSCEFQLNAPSLDGTKTYVLIFNALYENTGYRSYEE